MVHVGVAMAGVGPLSVVVDFPVAGVRLAGVEPGQPPVAEFLVSR